MSLLNATPRPPPVAPAPFDNPTVQADLILRTSDHVLFKVHKQILKIASSVFETLLPLPHTPENQDPTTGAECPVMDVAEDKETLDILLRICYPIEQNKPPDSLDKIELALKAAKKYEMARPMEVLTEAFELRALSIAEFESSSAEFESSSAESESSSAPANLFGAWAAACRLGHKQLARHVADLMCRRMTYSELDTLPDCSAGPSAGDYHRLREYINGTPSLMTSLLTPGPTQLQRAPVSEPRASTGRSPAVNIEQMPFADLVCRSSDSFCFEVHRGVVAAASPRLHEMITSILPDCSSASPDLPDLHILPVLQLDERGSTLAALLRICYPATFELPQRPGDYAALVRAADKYAMHRIHHELQEKWAVVCRAAPLEAYFAAAGTEWNEGAMQAARYVPWRYPHLPELPYTPAMEDAPAIAYQRLVLHRQSFKRGVLLVLWGASQSYRDFLMKCTAFGPESHVNGECCDDLALLEAIEEELPRECRCSHGLSRLRDITLRAQPNLEKVNSDLYSSVVLNRKLSTMSMLCHQIDLGR